MEQDRSQTTIMKVSELSADLVIVDNDMEVQSVKDFLGEDSYHYDTFFVSIRDGEYAKIYGVEGTIPLMDKEAIELL